MSDLVLARLPAIHHFFIYPTAMAHRKLVIPVLCFAISAADCLQFELQSGTSKCITEDIKPNTLTVGRYAVVNPKSDRPIPDYHKINTRVVSPYGNTYHDGTNVLSGEFGFTAKEGGNHMACFRLAARKPPVKVAIDFDWKTGVSAKSLTGIVKKGQTEIMEDELKKLYLTVASIHDEMFYLRVREDEMQNLIRGTNSKMATYSFFSLLVCLSVAGLQLWHLKAFFERKKLI